MTICAHRTTLLLFSLLFTVWLTFLLLAIGEFMGGDLRLQRGGGIVGIVASALAWYGMVASLLTKKNSLFRLPLGEMDAIYKRWGWILPDEHKE
jgi:succinate-acetate transporter protein